MRRSIFTAFSPNLELNDAWLTWKLCCQPWRWREGEAVLELEERFRRDFGAKYAVAFESGRTALAVLLQTAPLEPGDEVALQAYTCVAVPNSVIWSGLEPLYIDCLEETRTMSPDDLEKKITSRTKAIIIQHTFGMVGRLEEVLAIARRNNLVVIEDSAHVIGGRYRGQLLGTWGDASFFSFGKDKAISGIFGGLALTNDEAWGRRLGERQKAFPSARRSWILKQLCHPLVSFQAKFCYDFFGLGRVIFWLAKRVGLVSRAVTPEERQGKKPDFVFRKMPNALAQLILQQYGKLQRFNEHRKKIAASYWQLLSGLPEIRLPSLERDSFFLRFPITVSDRQRLIQRTRQEKIYLGDWYDVPIAPPEVEPSKIHYEVGSCPAAERLSRGSLNLPTDIHVTEENARKIAVVIRSCFN